MEKIKHYLNLMRFDKPVGTLLLFLPCAFGVALNASQAKDSFLLIPFLIGSFVMRSSGCIINDIWDRGFDSKVARTADRPIASGKISVMSALILCAILCLIGLIVLFLFSRNTILFSFLSVPLFVIYPLMKRYTYFPQAFLGFTFNFGILVASMELNNEITIPSLILYLGSVFWTMGYDTIYGFMDIVDDKKTGIKSLSILIEKHNPKAWLFVFYLVFVLFIAASGYLMVGKFGALQAFVLCLILAQFIWQVKTLDLQNPQDCLSKFKSNIGAGVLVFAFLLL